MKNIHIITLLAAGLFLAAAIATYRPSASSFSGQYSLTDGYSVTPVTGSLYPDAAKAKEMQPGVFQDILFGA